MFRLLRRLITAWRIRRTKKKLERAMTRMVKTLWKARGWGR